LFDIVVDFVVHCVDIDVVVVVVTQAEAVE